MSRNMPRINAFAIDATAKMHPIVEWKIEFFAHFHNSKIPKFRISPGPQSMADVVCYIQDFPSP